MLELAVPSHSQERGLVSRARGGEEREHIAELHGVAHKGGVVELSAPLELLGLSVGQPLGLFVALDRERRIVETLALAGDDGAAMTFALAAYR